MPDDVIQVNYEQLEDVVRRWDRCADTTDAILSGLSRTMDDLRGGWEGEASKRFFDEMEGRVLPRLRRLNQALAESQQTTRQLVRTFQEAEEQAAQLFSGTGGAGAGLGKGLEGLLSAALPGMLLGAAMFNPATFSTVGSLIGGSLIRDAIASAMGGGASGLKYGDTYNWGKAALDGFKLYDKLSKFSDEILDKGAYKLADNLASMGASDLKGFYSTLEKMSPATKVLKEASKIGLGGLIDWGLGEDHSAKELGVQIVSQGIQALPYVRGAALVSDAFQLVGNVGSELIEQNAFLLTGGDPQKAQALIDSSNKFQKDLEKVSVDQRIDGMVRSAFNGDLGGIVNEAKTFVSGLGDVATSGYGMISKTAEVPLQKGREFVEGAARTISQFIPKVDFNLSINIRSNLRIGW